MHEMHLTTHAGRRYNLTRMAELRMARMVWRLSHMRDGPERVENEHERTGRPEAFGKSGRLAMFLEQVKINWQKRMVYSTVHM